MQIQMVTLGLLMCAVSKWREGGKLPVRFCQLVGNLRLNVHSLHEEEISSIATAFALTCMIAWAGAFWVTFAAY
jgi:hypothetical protein